MTMPSQPDPNFGDSRRPQRPTAEAGPGLRMAYTSALVFVTCFLITYFGGRLLGLYQLGTPVPVGTVIGMLLVSALATAAIVFGLYRRRR